MIKPLTIVTAPERAELKEWSGQPGVVISTNKKGEAVVLVASSTSPTRAARFVFPVAELREGGEASEYLLNAAADHVKNHEAYEAMKREYTREEKLVEEYLDKLQRVSVRMGSASDSRQLWIDYGTYGNTIHYTTLIYNGAEVARLVKNRVRLGDGERLRALYERITGAGGESR